MFPVMTATNRLSRLVVALLVLAAGAAAPWVCAEPQKRPGVTVDLVSERTGIQAGVPFRVGMTIRHDSGFHTYWRQPGMVGLTPSIDWNLPRGFKAGPIQWPAPERTKMGMWGVWGFERDVCLVIEIAPPGKLTDSSITIAGKASWMACGKTCHPSFANLVLTLPVVSSEAPLSASAKLFAETRAGQPLHPAGWSFSARKSDEAIELTVTPPEGSKVPDDIYFYSFARIVDSHSDPVFKRLDDGRAVLTMKWVQSPGEVPKSLEGVLESRRGWSAGDRKATLLAVEAPWK